jgi:ribosomal protein S18 acetylase RimI-like enzyme
VSWFRSSPLRRRQRESPPPPPARPARPRGELEALQLAELHALAREAGLPRYRLLRRPQLVDALAGDAPAGGDSPATVIEAAPIAGRELRVEEARTASSELAAAVGILVRQLSRSASAPTEDELRIVVGSEAARLLVARDGDAVVGMLTLILIRTPTGARARVEDVVVDEASRGRGVGEALVSEALRLARERGARTVDLTSNPGRAAANRLYEKLGFRRRDTNVFRADT